MAESKMYTIKEIADLHGVSKSVVNYAIQKNPGVKFVNQGNKRLISEDDYETISAYIEENKKQPKAEQSSETMAEIKALYESIIQSKDSEIESLKAVVESQRLIIENLQTDSSNLLETLKLNAETQKAKLIEADNKKPSFFSRVFHRS